MSTLTDQAFDWRASSVCDPAGADRAFDTAEDLMEDMGLTEREAREIAAVAVQEAKAVCMGCPVRARCRDTAMENEEEFGVWGGMSVEERRSYRSSWLKIKRIQGIPVTPVQKDHDALHDNAGVNSRYQLRDRRARATKDKLLLQGSDFVLDLGAKYGKHRYAELMKILDMVLANPESTAEVLAERIGRKAVWFNVMFRETCKAMGEY